MGDVHPWLLALADVLEDTARRIRSGEVGRLDDDGEAIAFVDVELGPTADADVEARLRVRPRLWGGSRSHHDSHTGHISRHTYCPECGLPDGWGLRVLDTGRPSEPAESCSCPAPF